MRTTLITLLCLVAALTVSSQTMYIHQGASKIVIPSETVGDILYQKNAALMVGKSEIPYAKIDSITFDDDENFVLCSKTPADIWERGYGVGNGRLGFLSYGTYPNETLVLNEGSIFGRPKISYRTNLPENIRSVREFCKKGNYSAANTLFKNSIIANEPSYSSDGSYQSGGLVNVSFVDMPAKASSGYQRRLNMLSGIGSTKVKLNDGSNIMTSYMSVPDVDVLAYRMVTDRIEGMNVSFQMTYPSGGNATSVVLNDSTLVLTGQAKNNGTKFENRINIITVGGTKKKSNGSILVTGASEIMLISSISTDYNIEKPTSPLDKNLTDANIALINNARKYSWGDMSYKAAQYFAPLLNRCTLNIGTTPDNIRNMATDERLSRLKSNSANTDPDLVETLFQFGRFCVISNSRPGGLPCGLQGLWNPKLSATWRGSYFLNINCQMNYWCTETTNLDEFHQPFLDLVLGLKDGGEEFASALGYDGFCFGHNVDVWRKTYFRGSDLNSAASLMSGAWAVAHLVDHYRFSNDKEFLKKSIPLLESNARFIMSWFDKDPITGKYISGPGVSPENAFYYTNASGNKEKQYVSNGVSHDQQLGAEALANYLYACSELGISNEFTTKAKTFLPLIEEPKIGADGRLMEWREPFDEYEKAHRHYSHCYGLFPSNSINLFQTKNLYDAVKKSVDARIANGGGATGWSRAWTINLYAALHDGDKAYASVKELFRKYLFSNLFDIHPTNIFQIDGNFGMTSGIANCLVQSQVVDTDGKRIIDIAPAISSEWSDGEAKGLTTRGGLTVDVAWHASQVTAKVTASRDIDCKLYCKGQFINCNLKKGQSQTFKF